MAYCRFSDKCSVYMYAAADGYNILLAREDGRPADTIVKKTPQAALRYLDKLIDRGTWDAGNDLKIARSRLLKEIKELKK
jgi:hypothetical protein